MTLTALIAEDEPLLQDQLAEALAQLWPELEIVGRARTGIEALRLFEQSRPAIAFLDIQMPGLTGLEVAKQLAGRAHVVFVTAYDRHAIAAFEQGAIDYILKPVNLGRLAATVQRLKERVAGPPADLAPMLAAAAAPTGENCGHLRWVNVSAGNAIKLVTVDEICYFQGEGAYTAAVTPSGKWRVRKPITELADELDPREFVPVDGVTLVNVHAIADISRDPRGHLQVALRRRPERLDVDEAYRGAAKGESVTGGPAPDRRRLATVMFTDIVDSTATAARIGDRAWTEILDEHDRRCRRAIGRFGGRWIKSTGDGVFATFEGPARAIDSAIAIVSDVGELGIVTRAGIHTGECEVCDDDLHGIAVHVGSRIAALAGPGEVLVSGIVKDLVAEPGVAFVDRGEHVLRGIPGAVRVFAVARP